MKNGEIGREFTVHGGFIHKKQAIDREREVNAQHDRLYGKRRKVAFIIERSRYGITHYYVVTKNKK
jgi:hypothetical protein